MNYQIIVKPTFSQVGIIRGQSGNEYTLRQFKSYDGSRIYFRDADDRKFDSIEQSAAAH